MTAVVNVQNEASAVAVTAAVGVVVAMNAVTARKDVANSAVSSVAKADQKPGATNVVNAAPSRALNNAQTNAMISAVNKEMKARSSASHARRVNRASHAKAVARSGPAVNAVSVLNAASSARQWMPLSKTSHWPTRPPWLRPWAAQLLTLARKHHAESAENGVANAVAATNAVMNHRANHVQNHEQIARTLQMHRPPGQLDR